MSSKSAVVKNNKVKSNKVRILQNIVIKPSDNENCLELSQRTLNFNHMVDGMIKRNHTVRQLNQTFLINDDVEVEDDIPSQNLDDFSKFKELLGIEEISNQENILNEFNTQNLPVLSTPDLVDIEQENDFLGLFSDFSSDSINLSANIYQNNDLIASDKILRNSPNLISTNNSAPLPSTSHQIYHQNLNKINFVSTQKSIPSGTCVSNRTLVPSETSVSTQTSIPSETKETQTTTIKPNINKDSFIISKNIKCNKNNRKLVSKLKSLGFGLNLLYRNRENCCFNDEEKEKWKRISDIFNDITSLF